MAWLLLRYGFVKGIMLSVDGGGGNPAGVFVYYARPKIVRIEAPDCGSVLGSPLEVVRCSRDGGARITLHGHDFGDPALVFVGTATVETSHLDPLEGMERVEFELPVGTGNQLAIVLLQPNGQLSDDPAKISYEPVRCRSALALRGFLLPRDPAFFCRCSSCCACLPLHCPSSRCS